MNETEIRLNNKRSSLLKPSLSSNPFKSEADNDYEKKKEKEKKEIMNQINRVSLNQTLI